MLTQRIEEAFNKQLNAELYSSYLYLSMTAYFQARNLIGFANWMRCQAQEEILHAMKFYTFIHVRASAVTVTAIEAPPTTWESPLKAFEDALAHERKVTGLINNLVDLAIQEKDHAANAFLQWFVTEQVEEEESADDVIQKIKLAGEQGGGMFMLDRELATRVFVYPTAQQAE